MSRRFNPDSRLHLTTNIMKIESNAFDEAYYDDDDKESTWAVELLIHKRHVPHAHTRCANLKTPFIDIDDYWIEFIKFTNNYLNKQERKLRKKVWLDK